MLALQLFHRLNSFCCVGVRPGNRASAGGKENEERRAVRGVEGGREKMKPKFWLKFFSASRVILGRRLLWSIGIALVWYHIAASVIIIKNGGGLLKDGGWSTSSRYSETLDSSTDPSSDIM